jgi:signal transduction histidine kinase
MEIRIETELARDIPDLCIDEGRFAESIKELISNSIKAVSKNHHRDGLIRIATRREETAESPDVLVTVEDNGPGFPPNFPIFEPFNSTDPQSTGLGLATVKELVERHGGCIQARPSRYGGACIEFSIPIQP